MRPNGDAIEVASWNERLSKPYPDRAALAAAVEPFRKRRGGDGRTS
jgi:hypothetical protein